MWANLGPDKSVCTGCLQVPDAVLESETHQVGINKVSAAPPWLMDSQHLYRKIILKVQHLI